MNRILIYLIISAVSFLYISCGSSTGSRYEKNRDKSEASSPENKSSEEGKEFDISPYRAVIIVPETEKKDTLTKPDIWYNYAEPTEPDTAASQRIIDKKDGYRVQVYSTDNLDEANSVRSEVLFKANQKNVYLIFEPPFYKVKVGDYLNMSDANQMNFKLNQLGYTESRVVKDSVNIYQ